MRQDTVLIQQASGEYQALLALTVQRHLAYCLTHEMDYWPIFGEARPGSLQKLSPHYDRIHLIETALNAGYKSVVWLDADCIILGNDDLREGIPPEGIGALWCEQEAWDRPELYNHFCTGALYIPNTPPVQYFVNTWKWLPCDGHGWRDQHTFNRLNSRLPMATPISRHWHSILPDYLPEDDSTPQVVAFHGYGNLEQRLAAMEAIFTGEAANGVL